MSKKFQFRLQRVMDARESEEKQCQRELGAAMEELRIEENKLVKLELELEDHIEKQRKLLEKSASAAEMVIYNRWYRQLKRQIMIQKEEVEKKKIIVEQKREKLIEVSKEKKVLEKLKEKKLAEYLQEFRKSQQNQLDDIGTKIWSKNSSNSDGSVNI